MVNKLISTVNFKGVIIINYTQQNTFHCFFSSRLMIFWEEFCIMEVFHTTHPLFPSAPILLHYSEKEFMLKHNLFNNFAFFIFNIYSFKKFAKVVAVTVYQFQYILWEFLVFLNISV